MKLEVVCKPHEQVAEAAISSTTTTSVPNL